MASSSLSRNLWTAEENKYFEQILAVYDKDTPDRWQNIARALRKSVEDVKRQYKLLEKDVRAIESGNFQSQSYWRYR